MKKADTSKHRDLAVIGWYQPSLAIEMVATGFLGRNVR